MYCQNCGTQLPDDASFCLKCGRPQQAGVQAQTATPLWETCEIQWRNTSKKGFFSNPTICFVAERIGPDGTQIIGITENVISTHPASSLDSKEEKQQMYSYVDQLKANLLRDGWEPTGQGRGWWELSFRRRVK